jgi:hypothetical protein
MQQYAKAAKELLDNVAKLTVRQDAGQPRPPAPILLQASASPAQAPTSSRPTVPLEARISTFKQELLASRIDLDELRRLAFQGIPDKDGLRAMTWKVGVASRRCAQAALVVWAIWSKRGGTGFLAVACSMLLMGEHFTPALQSSGRTTCRHVAVELVWCMCADATHLLHMSTVDLC